MSTELDFSKIRGEDGGLLEFVRKLNVGEVYQQEIEFYTETMNNPLVDVREQLKAAKLRSDRIEKLCQLAGLVRVVKGQVERHHDDGTVEQISVRGTDTAQVNARMVQTTLERLRSDAANTVEGRGHEQSTELARANNVPVEQPAPRSGIRPDTGRDDSGPGGERVPGASSSGRPDVFGGNSPPDSPRGTDNPGGEPEEAVQRQIVPYIPRNQPPSGSGESGPSSSSGSSGLGDRPGIPYHGPLPANPYSYRPV